jgi:RNA polymerase sigma factor (sigma-70 family)
MPWEAIPVDEELIEQFLSGSRAQVEWAFELLVRRHGPRVLRICRQVLHRCEDAEDAFQTTFLALVRHAGSIRDRSALGGWLHGVAYRVAIRAATRGARRPWRPMTTEPETSLDAPEVVASRNEARPMLLAEVDRLPEGYRNLVVRCYLEGWSNEEAARLLGCPIGTVKARLWRARGLLRERLCHSDLGA